MLKSLSEIHWVKLIEVRIVTQSQSTTPQIMNSPGNFYDAAIWRGILELSMGFTITTNGTNSWLVLLDVMQQRGHNITCMEFLGKTFNSV